MNKLILVEGIPGSGKTTIANKVKEYLISKGKKAQLFNEGDNHPVDLAWISYLTLDEYNELLKSNPEYQEVIKKNTTLEDNHALIAYTKLGLHHKENVLMKYFEDHEINTKNVSLDTYKKLLFRRWDQFYNNVEKDVITIFECAYLQNHVNELLAYNNKDEAYIVEYMKELIQKVKGLNPKLIYLTQPSVFETISRVAKKRVTSDKSKWDDWIDLVINYIETCPYGVKHHLKGFDGVISFFEKRKDIELKVIKELPIDKVIIENNDYNWDLVLRQVLANIDV